MRARVESARESTGSTSDAVPHCEYCGRIFWEPDESYSIEAYLFSLWEHTEGVKSNNLHVGNLLIRACSKDHLAEAVKIRLQGILDSPS